MSIYECIDFIKNDERLSELQRNYMLAELYKELEKNITNECLEMWD